MTHELASSKSSVLSSLPTLTLATVFCDIATAQSNNNDCTNVLLSMSPCFLNNISTDSSIQSTACCTQLGTVAKSQPQCFCQVLNGGGSNLGLTIDKTQATELSKACNVQTPPVSQCSVNSPTGSPGLSPKSGSKIEPSSGNNSSDVYSKKLAVLFLFFLFFMA